VIVLTSLLRHRVQHRTWRLLHQLAWPMWLLSLSHGVGMGTDLRDGWWLVTVTCAAVVPMAAVWRLALRAWDRRDERAATPLDDPSATQPLRVLR
jgi:sulfoxide reductase heme-binding subunit YedZ